MLYWCSCHFFDKLLTIFFGYITHQNLRTGISIGKWFMVLKIRQYRTDVLVKILAIFANSYLGTNIIGSILYPIP